MPDREYVIPPRQPGESELRVILTDNQARDFEAAYDYAHRMVLLTEWGGVWTAGERERFTDFWNSSEGNIHD